MNKAGQFYVDATVDASIYINMKEHRRLILLVLQVCNQFFTTKNVNSLGGFNVNERENKEGKIEKERNL